MKNFNKYPNWNGKLTTDYYFEDSILNNYCKIRSATSCTLLKPPRSLASSLELKVPAKEMRVNATLNLLFLFFNPQSSSTMRTHQVISSIFTFFIKTKNKKTASTLPPALQQVAGQVLRQISAAEHTQIASRFIHMTTHVAAVLEKHTIKTHSSAVKAATLQLFAMEWISAIRMLENTNCFFYNTFCKDMFLTK